MAVLVCCPDPAGYLFWWCVYFSEKYANQSIPAGGCKLLLGAPLWAVGGISGPDNLWWPIFLIGRCEAETVGVFIGAAGFRGSIDLVDAHDRSDVNIPEIFFDRYGKSSGARSPKSNWEADLKRIRS
jgi:hypothetical protein